jgi:hypothetical protein
MNIIFPKIFFIIFWTFINSYDVAHSSSYQSFNHVISPTPTHSAPVVPFLNEESKLIGDDYITISLEDTPSPQLEKHNDDDDDKKSPPQSCSPSQWSTTKKSIVFIASGSFVCLAFIGGGIGLYWWLCQGSTSDACLVFMSTK